MTAGDFPLLCLSLFLLVNNLPAIRASVGTNCSLNNDCSGTGENCRTSLCECKDGYFDDNGGDPAGSCAQKVGLGSPCNQTDACSDTNAMCGATGSCVCNSTYYDNNGANPGGSCTIKVGLGSPCNQTDACSDTNAMCGSTGSCVCKPTYYDNNYATPGGSCTSITLLEVRNLTVLEVGEGFLKLGWANPTNDADVDKFEVTWQRGNNISMPSNVSKNVTATLQNLIPGATYNITVTSFHNNEAKAVVQIQQATRPMQPGSIDRGKSDLDTNGSTIMIVWSYAMPVGVNLVFLVQLFDANTSRPVGNINNASTSSVSIPSNDLKNGYKYNVSITVQSETFIRGNDQMRENSSTHSEVIKTNSTAPNHPTDVICSNIQDMAINLNWKEPVTPNGDILYYVVQTYSFVNQSTPIISNNTMSASTSFEVTGLEPGSYYRFKVFTVNDHSMETLGEWSPEPYCRTKPLMSQAPINLHRSGVITSRAFTVSWEKPYNTYGELVGYILEIINMESGECVVKELTTCITDQSSCTEHFPHNNISSNCNRTATEMTVTKTELALERSYTGSFYPYTLYKVSVAAVNPVGNGHTSVLNVTTLEEAPSKPSIVYVGNITARRAIIQWSINGPRPGKTDYTITAIGITQPENRMHTLSGFYNRTYEFTDLEEYRNYSVIVQASTSIGTNQSDSVAVTTLPGAAGSVDSLGVDKGLGDDMYVTARVFWKLPEELERNGPINKFYVQLKENYGNGTSSKVNEMNVNRIDDDMYSYIVTFAVQPEANYTFMVRAETGSLIGSESFRNYSAIPGPPVNIEKQGFDVIPADKVSAPSKTSFRIEINRNFFLNSKNGAIRDKGLICCKDPTCKYDNSTITTSDEMKNMKTYAQAKESGSNKYRLPETNTSAKEQVSGRKKRATDNILVYDVGIESCDGLRSDQYCNGPLDPGSTYRIIAFVCTSMNCTLSKSYGPFITLSVPSEPEFPVGAVVGGIVGGVAALTFIVVFILLLRYRSKKGKRARKALDDDNDPSHMENLVKIKKQRPVKLANFAEYVADYHKDSNLKFSEEYEDLKTLSPQHSHEAADMEENRLKNRFVNILPFDHSRVRLLPIDDVPGSDYINANYLPGFSKTREYIACQGPIPATIDDHWRLIWEQNVRVIVMLTQYKEENRVKCEPYMPLDLKDPKQYGDLVVECLTYSSMNSFEYRTLKVRLGEKERTIKHFHFLSWRDYSANVQFDTMIDFIKKVRSFIQPPDVEGPMIVHCSAGVGRTGTYITIDHVIQHIDKYGPDSTMDIFNFVLKLRENRTTMVQTEQQYIFIHDCIKEYLDRFKTYENQAFIGSEEENLYQNTETTELYQNVNFNSTQKTEL